VKKTKVGKHFIKSSFGWLGNLPLVGSFLVILFVGVLKIIQDSRASAEEISHL